MVYYFPLNGRRHYGTDFTVGCALAAEAVRRTIQNSQESLSSLALWHQLRKRLPSGRKELTMSRSSHSGQKRRAHAVLSILGRSGYCRLSKTHAFATKVIVSMPCKPTIPRLTKSSSPALFDGTARLPDVEGNKPSRKKFKQYPIGYFHIDTTKLKNCRG